MWVFENIEINSIEQFPEGTHGFIYEVEHLPTGKKYLGKKVLHFERTLPPLKGTKRKRHIIKESDWMTYYGSQAEIKDLVKKGRKEDFKKVILQMVPTKKLLTYYELKYLFVKGVIEPGGNYINSNISGHFYRRDFMAEGLLEENTQGEHRSFLGNE